MFCSSYTHYKKNPCDDFGYLYAEHFNCYFSVGFFSKEAKLTRIITNNLTAFKQHIRAIVWYNCQFYKTIDRIRSLNAFQPRSLPDFNSFKIPGRIRLCCRLICGEQRSSRLKRQRRRTLSGILQTFKLGALPREVLHYAMRFVFDTFRSIEK